MGTHDDRAVPGASPSIAIIGAGFGGLGMAYYLKRAGIHSFTLFEKAQDLGGVWRDNHYPGAACDVASHLYSFAFEPHYPWSRRYGPQREIHAYLAHVADKYALRPHIRFGREVLRSEFNQASGLWTLHFADGSTHHAKVVISAVGQLNRPKMPEVQGLDKFRGRQFHSAHWDHSYDLRDKTVAVIGTGPSAVQFVPAIAAQVKQLYVYQRSTSWTLPKFDGSYSLIERWLLTHLPFLHTLDRWRIYWWYEFLASALQNHSRLGVLSRAVLRVAARLLMRSQIKDEPLRAKLTPDSPVGCKRILLSNEWLPALARPNVEVVTDSVLEVTENGVRSADGHVREVDALIYGTGFASTQFLAPMEFIGLGGQSLQQRWKDGAVDQGIDFTHV
ncbi:MAG: flavin-containing monooxygenase, partial [Panacagrimonas sp.]